MRCDAIILARGGSKGIPNKNLKLIFNEPLLFWTIKKLKLSKKVDEIWVSSDSDSILEYSLKNKVKIIKRPLNISDDYASSESGWSHAITHIENEIKTKTDLILAPQVTSPIRMDEDFDNSIDTLINEKADSLLSVCKLEDYFIWEDRDKHFLPVNHNYKFRKRRQIINESFLENGSIYLFKSKVLKDFNNRLGGKISYYLMKDYTKPQIDNPIDIRICEAIMKEFKTELNL